MTPAERHLTAEQLADLDAGLLEPGAAERARTHLAGCPDCAASAAGLAEVRRRLAAVSTGPMPPDLADRLDTAVRAAVAGDGTANVATVVPATPRLRRGPRTGLASAAAVAAAAVLVAGVVAGVLRLGAHHQPNAPTSAAGPLAGRPHAPSFVESTSGRNYTRTTLVSDLPLLLAGAPVGSLSASAPAPSRGPAAGGSTTGAAGALPPALARLHDSPQALFACVSALTGEPVLIVPRAVDFARYEGTPAAVFVLPSRTRLGWVQIWVIGPGGCSTSATDVRFFAQAFVP